MVKAPVVTTLAIAEPLIEPMPALAITALVAAIVVAMLVKIREMQVQLRIPTEELVHGDLMVAGEAERLDLLMEQEERIEAARS